MAAFPIAKLAALLIKQVGKPLANFAKERAKSSHFFRIYVCMPPAQFYHWCEVRMKMHIMNIGKTSDKTVVPKLNEQAAIELGASLLGEGVIFLIGAGILGFEYNRQKTNERKKEQAEEDFLISLKNKVNDLSFANEELDVKMRELTRLLYTVNSKIPNVTEENTEVKSNSMGIIGVAIEDVQMKMKQKT